MKSINKINLNRARSKLTITLLVGCIASAVAVSSASAAVNVMQIQSGATFSTSQVRRVKESYAIKNGDMPPPKPMPPKLDGDLSGVGSSASQFVAKLKLEQQKGRINYILLFHEVTETTLLTITKRDKKREEQAKVEAEKVYQCKISIYSEDDTGKSATSCNILSENEQIELAKTLAPIRERLKVGQKILLAAAWCREDENISILILT